MIILKGIGIDMTAVITSLNIALVLVLLIAAGVIVWRIITARRVPVSMYLFFVLPVGQFLMLYSISFEQWSIFWLMGLVLSLAANALILAYTISQEKTTAAQEELRDTQHKIDLEKSHYEAVQQRMEELEIIRKDFSEKLETVANLARVGEDATARENIALLAEKINNTRENLYCDVPVINAILTEKEEECSAAGITLSIDLKVPDTLNVAPMHMCSIFSNILDNAINACKKVQETKNHRSIISRRLIISLSSKVDGDYLFIKAKNPSEKPYFSASGKGYGLKILNDMAKRYSGAFQSNYHEGIYTVFISLLAKE